MNIKQKVVIGLFAAYSGLALIVTPAANAEEAASSSCLLGICTGYSHLSGGLTEGDANAAISLISRADLRLKQAKGRGGCFSSLETQHVYSYNYGCSRLLEAKFNLLTKSRV